MQSGCGGEGITRGGGREREGKRRKAGKAGGGDGNRGTMVRADGGKGESAEGEKERGLKGERERVRKGERMRERERKSGE